MADICRGVCLTTRPRAPVGGKAIRSGLHQHLGDGPREVPRLSPARASDTAKLQPAQGQRPMGVLWRFPYALALALQHTAECPGQFGAGERQLLTKQSTR
jgi:hypothetical protein